MDGDLSYHDLLRTGPGTIAGRYLRQFWQPVYRAIDLPRGRAAPIKVMSEDFTLYRGESGTPYLVAQRCAHRGAQLSVGWVEGEHIRCVYHAWKYDGSGQCVEQPAEPRPFCQRVKIASYPVREYLGIVFAYLGEGEPPPFPRRLEYEDPDYVHLLRTDTWPCNYFAQLENALDKVHTEFLHWHFNFTTPRDIKAEETAFGVAAYTPGLSGANHAFDVGYVTMPNSHEWAQPPVPGAPVGNFACGWRVPVDDEHHLRINLAVYPARGAAAAALRARFEASEAKAKAEHTRPVSDYANALLSGRESMYDLKERGKSMSVSYLTNVQDCTAMTGQGPLATREINEMLGYTDQPVVALRRIWTRELAAFQAGEPLTTWTRPDHLWDVTTLQP
jgi:5,5'-dehydrodivanillate O-demethylase